MESRKLTGARRPRPGLYSLLSLALLLGIPLPGQSPFAQYPSSNGAGRLDQRYPDSGSQFPQDPNSPDQKRIRLLNAERQKSLVSDVDKLLKLAKELNDEVVGSDSSSMSDEQLHKVAEIGKLAKSVKEKMSYSVGGYPGVNAPLTTAPGIQ
jgi:single-stranded DNA-specific DHH superfamily exonuclease